VEHLKNKFMKTKKEEFIASLEILLEVMRAERNDVLSFIVNEKIRNGQHEKVIKERTLTAQITTVVSIINLAENKL